MFSRLSSASVYATLLLSVALEVTASQPSLQDLDTRDQGTWTNAYCLPSQPQDLSAAAVATCPSWAPIACTAISEPGYCCNPSTYCARASDNSIGCCPWGQTCSPVVAGGAAAAAAAAAQPQQHSTTWNQQPTTQTSTVYTTQTHPYAVAAAPEVTTVYAGSYGQGNQGWGQGSGQGQWQGGGAGQQGQEGQGGGGGQQYCSTLYAHGPNLPTTEAGTCGTILILNAAIRGTEVGRWKVLCIWLIGTVVVGV
ncbi:hypothetical protein M436DRAFT_59815 [Aureobasidium namibiae CBS 147.97]|uniref:Uncharacterized protein n=1 Tax=Aureobasidium namibiae CBS 147.97 TaxID=1043004 RepID=A0A074XTF7_9PEZI